MTRRPVLRAASLVVLAAAILLDSRRVVSGLNPIDPTFLIEEINMGAVNKRSTGGRIERLAQTSSSGVYYAASEFGGLYRTLDGGETWTRVDSFVPQATSHVVVDPLNDQKIYVTSLYDGRVNSLAGISISEDGGATWTIPPTSIPPEGFCDADRREQNSAFGISIDPANRDHVWIGTNCGVAGSIDGGATWTFYDPTPEDPADRVVDVAVHDGVVDIIGDDGHSRSIDGGVNWSTPDGFPIPSSYSGTIDVSPDEDHVLFVTAGLFVYESDDGGNSWEGPIDVPGRNQGRSPFVKTNDRTGAAYDLWSGDVQLRRTSCTTPDPPNPGGALRCDYDGWSGALHVGAHPDIGDLAFDPTVAVNACPRLFANDGGVHVNTVTSSPGCHTPAWKNPTESPHALWLWSIAVAPASPAQNLDETLLIGTQDNGPFAAFTPTDPVPQWHPRRDLGDVFDIVTSASRSVVTICCKPLGGAEIDLASPYMSDPVELVHYPPGKTRGFIYGDAVAEYAPDEYMFVTDAGAFVTSDLEGNPVVWTELGDATYPAGATHSVRVSRSGGPVFVVQHGGNSTFTSDSLWRFDGVNPANAWQPITPPGGAGGFRLFAVHPTSPSMMIASHLPVAGNPQMVKTFDGGANWDPMPALDALMTSNGQFHYRNQFGPSLWRDLDGYPQPTLITFDPIAPHVVVAGATDAGLFFSRDHGEQWTRVRHPKGVIDGTPHITRPHVAAFQHQEISMLSDKVIIYVGTRGRGVFRVSTKVASLKVFDICKINPSFCYPIPKEPPFEFVLRPFEQESLYFSPLADHGTRAEECSAGSRGGCPAFFNLFLDGFDSSSWDVTLVDRRGAEAPHTLFRTERGVVLSVEGFEGLFSNYQLYVAQRSGARGVESRFTSRLEAAAEPYVPRSLNDIVF